MGNTNRADRISKHFTTRAMQAVGYFVFDKCGNCVDRLSCLVEGTLRTGGHPDPLRKVVDDLSKGCINPKNYKGTGIVPRNVGKVVSRECKGCNKLEICVRNVCKHLKITDEVEIKKLHEQVIRCTECDRVDHCVQHYMDEFNLRSYKMVLNVFLKKFKKCKTQNMQRVSIDMAMEEGVKPKTLNIGTTNVCAPSNVGGKNGDDK